LFGNHITQLDKSNPTYKETEWAIMHTAGALYGGMFLIASEPNVILNLRDYTAAGSDTTAATMEV